MGMYDLYANLFLHEKQFLNQLSSAILTEQTEGNTTDKSNVFIQRSHGEDERSGSEGSGSEEDDDYVPYVPVKIRKQQMVSCCALQKLVRLHKSDPQDLCCVDQGWWTDMTIPRWTSFFVNVNTYAHLTFYKIIPVS